MERATCSSGRLRTSRSQIGSSKGLSTGHTPPSGMHVADKRHDTIATCTLEQA